MMLWCFWWHLFGLISSCNLKKRNDVKVTQMYKNSYCISLKIMIEYFCSYFHIINYRSSWCQVADSVSVSQPLLHKTIKPEELAAINELRLSRGQPVIPPHYQLAISERLKLNDEVFHSTMYGPICMLVDLYWCWIFEKLLFWP